MKLEETGRKAPLNTTRVATPNDPKLSDGRGWRDRCVAGARRRQEAAGVTAAPVRWSAWLGVTFNIAAFANWRPKR